jgi:membrane protein DedA with SNARE-associated domain
MTWLANFDPAHLVAAYGYLAVAIAVGLESMGVPVPGETVLIAAAIWVGAHRDLNIMWVIAAASAGAAIGDSIGYWIGRTIGFRLLARYGAHFGLTEERLKLGQYLFLRYGGAIVFFGRFVALLRTLAALLAGVNQMPWPHFLLFNVSGGILWATAFGLGGYLFGEAVLHVGGPISLALLICAIVAAVAAFLFIRRHERRMLAEADRALPGPLADHPPRRGVDDK